MNSFNYNKKEIKVFEKALKTVLDDLENLWNLNMFERLVFDVELPGISACENS